MKRIVIIIILIINSVTIFPQGDGIKWLTFQEAEKLSAQSFRPIFIDTYTDWCGWCKKMDQETFTNNVIADILNTKFYPVKFDAEGKDAITFLGQTFINDGKYGKTHQLAVALMNGQLSYPTVIILTKQDEKYQVSPVPGFRQAKEMEMLLTFFSDKAYETRNWQDYQSTFRGKIQ